MHTHITCGVVCAHICLGVYACECGGYQSMPDVLLCYLLCPLEAGSVTEPGAKVASSSDPTVSAHVVLGLQAHI